MHDIHVKGSGSSAAALVAALGLLSGLAQAAPTVNGDVIAWSEPGWHQVQDQVSFASLCEGGSACTVPAGVYIVINHRTGERFKNIVVSGSDDGVPDMDFVPGPVAATGQTESYRFGDDGDYRSGASVAGERFRDNEDGTFTDRLTGIVWLSDVACFVQRDWAGAVDHANALSADSETCSTLADHSVAGDWRLPNIKELYSLVDIAEDTALLSGKPINGNVLEGSRFDNYWSSSSFRPVPETTGWAIEPNFGRPTVLGKTEPGLVWPIRDTR